MTPSTRRRLLSGLAVVAATGPSRSALAQTPVASGLPAGPVRMLIGYPVGGGTDVLIRVIAEKLRERIGANVVIENKPGASGVLAGVALKTAPPDGSVLMFAPSVSTVQQKVTRKVMPFDLEKDLSPVALAGTVGTVYVVSASIGVNSLPEYVRWLKANPRRANFGTAAMGSTTHFFGVELGQALGVALEPIAYKGTGPLMTDLVAGHVPAGCGGLTSFLQHHRSGQVRILALSSPKRASAAPDLPTIVELGYPNLASDGFYAFYAPANTPTGVISAWYRELKAVLEMPEIRPKLVSLGMEVQTGSPAELLDFQRRSIVSFTASMKAAGFEPE